MNFIDTSCGAPTKSGFTGTPRKKGLHVQDVFYVNFRSGLCGAQRKPSFMQDSIEQ